MKTIVLTQNKVALVDDGDFDELSNFNWYAQRIGNTFYAVRMLSYAGGIKRKVMYMHRQILGEPQGGVIDHVNHNGLDNRHVNLRVCTHSENHMNIAIPKNNTSGVKGVSWDKQHQKWEAYIIKHRKKIHLGLFKNKQHAREERMKANEKYQGEFVYV